MNVPSGLICEFVRKDWNIIADSTKSFDNISYVEKLLTCSIGYYHSIDAKNSYFSFYFSKRVCIDSYVVSSNDGQHTLYNWDLEYYNSLSNTFDTIDSKKSYNTINNAKIIQLNSPILTHAVKVIGGLDKEGLNYYLKLNKIEFYGRVIFEESCKRQKILSDISCLLIFLFIL